MFLEQQCYLGVVIRFNILNENYSYNCNNNIADTMCWALIKTLYTYQLIKLSQLCYHNTHCIDKENKSWVKQLSQGHTDDMLLIMRSSGWVPVSVLVQAALTEYHRLDALKSEHLFLTALGLGGPRTRCLQTQGLVKALLLAYSWPSSCYVLTWQKEWEFSRVSFVRA